MNVTLTPEQQTALDKALSLARLDPPAFVFPCIRQGKKKLPTTQHGFYDASIDEDEIRRMWSTRPGNQVGVWTGPSGLLIEDIDEPGFNTLVSMDEVWESTLRYNTPSGGQHHIWPSPDPAPKPRAPIAGYEGIDRRSGASFAIWYGPAPSQADWAVMHAQRTPEWLLGTSSSGGSRIARSNRVDAAEGPEVKAWIDSLTDGDPIEKFIVATDHYGDAMRALVALVEHTRTFPTWKGTRSTFDILTDGYINSPVSTTPAEERPNKIFGMLRWALGATAEVEDMTWVLERFGDPQVLGGLAVPGVPASSGGSRKVDSQEASEDASTGGTALEEVAR